MAQRGGGLPARAVTRLTRDGVPGLGTPPPRPRSAGVLHLGLGAFHRAHQAEFFDRLLRKGHADWGIVAVNLRSPDIVTALAGAGHALHPLDEGRRQRKPDDQRRH